MREYTSTLCVYVCVYMNLKMFSKLLFHITSHIGIWYGLPLKRLELSNGPGLAESLPALN